MNVGEEISQEEQHLEQPQWGKIVNETALEFS